MKNSAIFLVIPLLLLSHFSVAYAQEDDYTPSSLILRVLTDGSVFVQYAVESDPSQARIDVEVFGSPRTNLIIRDDENNPIASTPNGTLLTVDSLGALELNFSYLTTGLTTKEGPLWNINITAPIETRIILPSGAAILDLSDIPNNLGVLDGKQYIDMASGDIAVYYVLGLPSPQKDAQKAINEAQSYIKAKEAIGYILSDALSTLEQAQSLYNSGDYIESEEKAKEAKNTAEVTIFKAERAEASLEKAARAVNQAQNEGRTTGFTDIEANLAQAQNLYDKGEYLESETLAEQVYQQSLLAEKPSGGNMLLYLGIIIIVVVGAYIYIRKTGGDAPLTFPIKDKGIIEVDLIKLFNKNPDLRLEDREVIKFLAENGGESFATEIRDRFDMPRSSAWRLIRRLIKEGIVEEKKIGNQSLVRIIEEYYK